MLNVRNIFRLCKQSAQSSLGRQSLFFSSNADDFNSKRPPKNENAESDSLDLFLSATYSRKTSKFSPKKSEATQVKPAQKQASESESLSVTNAPLGGFKAGIVVKKGKGILPLEDLLEDAHKRTKPSTGNAKPQGETHLKSDESTARTIKVALEKKQQEAPSTELLKRIRRIAEEVAQGAGPKSKEVAEDLIKNLVKATKNEDKPFDLNELTFEKEPKGAGVQNLDLLRNKIVSEEQIYKITPGLHGERHERPMEFHAPWSERVHPISVTHDLDVSLHPTKNIGIFKLETKENLRTRSCLLTYEKLERRERDLSHSYAPRNWFEQCIQWTEQGKLWHFPINNEQGLEEDQAVSFTEHIFLEDHLEGWCPTFGPIRHFMELVCLGLSKNPYLSVEEKIENIMWYRDYFEKHRELLEAAGTLNSGVTKVPALEAQ